MYAEFLVDLPLGTITSKKDHKTVVIKPKHIDFIYKEILRVKVSYAKNKFPNSHPKKPRNKKKIGKRKSRSDNIREGKSCYIRKKSRF